MSCNLTSIRLEIQKVTRIHISTRNEPDATTLFEKKLFLQKMLTQTRQWLIFCKLN